MDSDPPSRRRIALLGLMLVLVAVLVAAQQPTATEVGDPPALPSHRSLWFLAASLLAGLVGAVLCAAQTVLLGVDRLGEEREEESATARRRAVEGERLLRVASTLFLVLCVGLGAVAGAGIFARLGAVAPYAGSVAGLAWYVALADVLARHAALLHSAAVMKWVVRPALLLSAPLAPLAAAVGRLTRVDRSADGSSHPDAAARELRLLPHVQGVDRVFEEESVEMIDSVRDFMEHTARDIMTPRIEIEGVEVSTPPADIVARLRESPFSRLIIYRETLDDIAGILLSKEVLLNDRTRPLEYLRQPVFVAADMHLPELLRRLRAGRSHLAIVLDEYGGVCGIVTLHDLFEEVVGDYIEDEEEEEEFWIVADGPDRARLSGRVELWEANSELGLDLDESVARTVGGFLMARFGHVPETGEVLRVPGAVFTVRGVANNRVTEVEFERAAQATDDEELAEAEREEAR